MISAVVEVRAPGRNERLVHVERVGERAADAAEINPVLGEEQTLASTGANRGFDLLFRTAKVR